MADLVTTIGRQLKNQVANGEIAGPTNRYLGLGASAAIGGTDITLTTTTSFTEANTANGGYARKDLSGQYTTSASAVENINNQIWTANAAGTGRIDDFDMVIELWDFAGTVYVIGTWDTLAVRTITNGSTYETGVLPTDYGAPAA